MARFAWLGVLGVVACPLARSAASDEGSGALASRLPGGTAAFAAWTPGEEGRRLRAALLGGLESGPASRLGLDIVDILSAARPPEERERWREGASALVRTLSGPAWSEILGDEAVLGLRLEGPLPEVIAAARVDPERLADRHAELRALLAAARDVAPAFLALDDVEEGDRTISRLAVKGAPLALAVAGEGDVLAVSNSGPFLDAVLAPPPAEGDGGPAPPGAWVRALRGGAFGHAPDRRELAAWIDVPRVAGYLRSLARVVAAQRGEGAPSSRAWTVVEAIAGELASVRDVSVAAWAADGWLETGLRVRFAADRPRGSLETLVAEQEPIDALLERVPPDASAFWLRAGWDVARIHDLIRAFTRWKLSPAPVPSPEDPAGVSEDPVGVSEDPVPAPELSSPLRRDVLSWLEGGGAWIELGPDPGGGDEEDRFEHVVLVRICRQARAERIVREAVRDAARRLARRGHEPRIAVAPAAGAGFVEISMPGLPASPLVGFGAGLLVVGESADAVRSVLAAPAEVARLDLPARLGPPGRDLPARLRSVLHVPLTGRPTRLAEWLDRVGLLLAFEPLSGDAGRLAPPTARAAALLRRLDRIEEVVGWSAYDPEQRAIVSRWALRPAGPGS